ncbi:MAG: two-component system, chemotaxis family, protein-glutamate methylesterase/glutaminase [Gammaproteobacteria bacterium]|jgi:two-component system chemotaxis response regulator CheB|nr:two-component system, chemotaxis family, protein-glutamate methylesterase/glutaminase [Gammaproteobacteria bacterium]
MSQAMQTLATSTVSPQTKERIKVLIVDDSALVRRMLTEMLSSDPAITVLGTAHDAYDAREKIKALNPDVLTLDVEMPRMDGLTFLRNLMRLRPMPVIMVSSLTERGAEVTLDALSVGAVDYLSKPKIDLAATLADYRDELIAKVKAAASARVRAPSAAAAAGAGAVLAKRAPQRQLRTTERIIAIGASTGGTEAIKDVLIHLPPDTPGIVITQHIPKLFSGAFARRMNACCQLSVCEAEDGQQVLRGHAYIAPGDKHLLLVRDGARYVCRLDEGPPVNRHKPSVDVMFRSVAQQAGRNAIGVILTGMGKDGAMGLKEMRDAGSRTLAQDEATSIVWGMPGEAVAVGGAAEVMPLGDIYIRVLALADEMDVTRSPGAGLG